MNTSKGQPFPSQGDRLPPCAEEAEQGVIGCLLQDPAYCLPILAREGIGVRHFFDARYGELLSIVSTLSREGTKSIDDLLLLPRLKAANIELDFTMLTSLRDGVPSALNLEYYLSDLKEAFTRRAILQAAQRAIEIAYDPSHQLEALKNTAEQLTHHLSYSSGRNVPPPLARPLGVLVRCTNDDPSELLRSRFLCRHGTLLLCGPTGIGKSSLALQFAICWARGQECFGIAPARALKSLLIQAENDDGDMAEMRDGIIFGLRLTDAERTQTMENIFVAREDERTGAIFLQETVRVLLAEHKPDLLWLDPALSYLGGETSSQKDVGGFLRNGLNPLLREFDCGCVIVHHTNKPPTGKEKSSWAAGDFAYLGTGSAEWANHPRAVLALRSVGSHEVFELRAAKRGSRLDWRESDEQTKAFVKCLAHAKESGAIFWREAEADEMRDSRPEKRHAKEDLLPHVPIEKPIAKNVLIEKARAAGIGEKAARAYLTELVADGTLHLWKQKRTGTNPEVLVSRHPQPQPSLGME